MYLSVIIMQHFNPIIMMSLGLKDKKVGGWVKKLVVVFLISMAK